MVFHCRTAAAKLQLMARFAAARIHFCAAPIAASPAEIRGVDIAFPNSELSLTLLEPKDWHMFPDLQNQSISFDVVPFWQANE